MVAGGGASVIYADTVGDLGFAEELGNYAEYSGAPNTQARRAAHACMHAMHACSRSTPLPHAPTSTKTTQGGTMLQCRALHAAVQHVGMDSAGRQMRAVGILRHLQLGRLCMRQCPRQPALCPRARPAWLRLACEPSAALLPLLQETYAYAKTLLDCATASGDGRPRALVVGGGIANFTDVAATFKGIIQARHLSTKP
jgi:hypothetical protein